MTAVHILGDIEAGDNFLNWIMFSDEAYLHNAEHVWIWANEIPMLSLIMNATAQMSIFSEL